MTDPLAEQHVALVAYRDLDEVGHSMLLTYCHGKFSHYIIVKSYCRPHLILLQLPKSQKFKKKDSSSNLI